MLNLAIFLLIFISLCLLAWLVLKQYPTPKSPRNKISHRNRKAMDKNYQPLDKQTQSVITSLAFTAVFIINILTNNFNTPPIYQMTDNSSVSPLHDDGPSSDGTTTITVTNAVPRPLVFAIKQPKKNQDFELNSCQNCKIYANSSEVPKNVCEQGTTTTIDANPGENKVYWYYKNARINPINATWKIEPGRKYSICIIMDLSKGRSDWDNK